MLLSMYGGGGGELSDDISSSQSESVHSFKFVPFVMIYGSQSGKFVCIM